MENKYDIIIFGASGYTGEYVVEEVVRKNVEKKLKVAVAGRNKEKLQKTKEKAEKLAEINVVDLDIIIADVNDTESLKSMARKGKLIINCVGPYRFHGLKVVEACIDAGSDYLDICGEPQFLEEVQMLFSEKAKEKNIFILGSCGFDSIPAELGVAYLEDNFGGDVNSVEMTVAMHDNSKGSSSINVTTLECAVHGYAARNELRSIRKEIFKDKMPKSSYKPQQRGSVWWCEEAKRWCVPNLAADRSVVMRTQHLSWKFEQKRPVHFNAFFGIKSLWTVFAAIIFSLIFSTMSSFSFSRTLLLKFPSFFSFGAFTSEGPKRDLMKDIKCELTFVGLGWRSTLTSPEEQHNEPPNVKKVVKVTTPEPGYFGTSILVTQSAFTLLQERTLMPGSGGVLPPGFAFRRTNLIDRLRNNGFTFELEPTSKSDH